MIRGLLLANCSIKRIIFLSEFTFNCLLVKASALKINQMEIGFDRSKNQSIQKDK